MKKGKANVVELMQELERQRDTKKDFKAPAGRLEMQPSWGGGEGEGNIGMLLQGVGLFGVRETAHEQFGQYLEIPKRYYDRMKAKNPGLLAHNVNAWLQEKGAESRLVRTLDGAVRSIHSEKYRQLDNYDLMRAILPIISEDADFEVKSCEVTERRLYLQVVHKRLNAQLTGEGHNGIKITDDLSAGLVISNSEIGDGSLRVEPSIYTHACTNMMISGSALRKYHIGRAGGVEVEEAVEYFRDETRRADDQAFWMKCQDTVRGAFDEAKFYAVVKKLQDTTKDVIEKDVPLPGIIEVVASRYGFSEGEKKAVETNFLHSGVFSRYGVINAVTRAAEDVESYDRAVELERLGGEIVELTRKDWDGIVRDAVLVESEK